jgi:hypothetical protein
MAFEFPRVASFLPHFSRAQGARKKPRVADAAAGAAPSDGPRDAVGDLVTRLVKEINPPIDTAAAQQVTKDLRGRIKGGQVDLRDPGEELEGALRSLSVDGWLTLLAAADASRKGTDKAEMHLDLRLLPVVQPALMCTCELERVGLWMSPGDRTPHKAEIEKQTGLKVDVFPADEMLTRTLTQVVKRAVARMEVGTGAKPNVRAIVRNLKRRLNGIELNLSTPGKELESVMGFITPADWRAIQNEARARGGMGIAYVEVDARHLDMMLPALEKGFEGLSCVPVRVSPQDKPIDEQGLRQATGLNIKALPALEVPCAKDENLRKGLLELLEAVAAGNPRLQESGIDPAAVAQGVMDCAAFDEWGDLGWDFRKLDAAHVTWVKALPAAAFALLQESAEEAGLETAWLDLHDKFTLDVKMVDKIMQLSPVSRLSVAAPNLGIFIGLGTLRKEGGEDRGATKLKELFVRNPSGKDLGIVVPTGVKVRCEGGTASIEDEDEFGNRAPRPAGAATDSPPTTPTKV